MIELAFPWALLALPLPLLARWLLPPAAAGRAGALRVPFYRSVAALSGSGQALARGRARVAVMGLAWLLLAIAAAQPRWLGEPRSVATHGRDLMLALDLSGSMGAQDFQVGGRVVDRLTVVRAVARQFVQAREGDRVGLVLFGTRAFVQAPLTFDRETVAELLDEAEVGLAGKDTAIGDAIGLAVKHLRDLPAEQRVLVLLSDGAANAGTLRPIQAAELAAREGVRIYTIGLGGRGRVLRTPLGSISLGGSPELDEKSLAEVARITGGGYFRADDTEGLLDAYHRIDAREPTEGAGVTIRPQRALFHWPLALATALAAALALPGPVGELMDALRPARAEPDAARTLRA